MGRFVVGIAIFLVIGGVAFLFRDFLPSNAGELKVGDCFDVPSGDDVGDVQHHPCTDPHDGEVIFVGGFTGSETYPTTDGFDAFVKTTCVDKAFADYVGASFDASPDIDLGYFYPKAENWNKDKQITCYITPISGGKVSVSFKAGAAPGAS